MFNVRKIADSREPPGLERRILRRLPMWLVGGTVVPGLIAVFSRWFPAAGTVEEVAKRTYLIDTLCWGLLLNVWTAVFTIAIGCVVVMIMKGPHYQADSYPVEHADRPDPPSRKRRKTLGISRNSGAGPDAYAVTHDYSTPAERDPLRNHRQGRRRARARRRFL